MTPTDYDASVSKHSCGQPSLYSVTLMLEVLFLVTVFLRWSTHDLSTLGGTDLAETDAALITGPSKCSLWVDIGSSINLRLVFPTPWQIPWQAGSTMLKWTAILRGTTTLVYGLSNDLEALNTSYQIPQRCSSPFLPCMGTVLPSSPPAHLFSLTL